MVMAQYQELCFLSDTGDSKRKERMWKMILDQAFVKFIKQNSHSNILQCLIHYTEKRRELWKTRSWLFHHDTAPVYYALNSWEFLAKKHCCAGATTLLYRSGPLRLLFVSHVKESQRNFFF